MYPDLGKSPEIVYTPLLKLAIHFIDIAMQLQEA